MNRIAELLVLVTATFSSASAQSPPDSAKSTAAGPLAHLLLPVGLLVAGTVAMLPFDAEISRSLQAPDIQSCSACSSAANTFNTLGGVGAPIITVGLLAAGHFTGHDGIADAGWHATKALVIASALTFGIKALMGRARPVTAQWSDPGEKAPDSDEYRPIKLTNGWDSYPSGHVTAAFATASALSAELARHDPKAARIARPLMFAGAAAVGLARMYSNKHWASDVVAGAVIGTVVGSRVVARAHGGPMTLAGRLLPSGVVLTPAGPALAWSFPLR